MADDTRDIRPEGVGHALEGMKIEEVASSVEIADSNDMHAQALDPASPSPSTSSRSASKSMAYTSQSNSQEPKLEREDEEETTEAEITVTGEAGKPPKLSRKPTQKFVARSPALFKDSADSTEEATEAFQVIRDCIYGSKYMGYSEHDALDCDCSEEWSKYSDCKALRIC